MLTILLLVLTILLILFLILKLNVNPAISLVLGALFMGISNGAGLNETIAMITSGFGGTMTGIGLSVAFGVIIGQLLAEIGAVEVIAQKMLAIGSKKNSDRTLGVTGLIVSTPVFYDVGYVILMPLARNLSKLSKTLPHFAGALVAGLGIAHTFIPPTPGPMTGSEILGIDVGLTLLWGIVVSVPTFFISLTLYEKVFLNRSNFWNPEKDEDPNFEEPKVVEKKQKIGMLLAILPIFIPIALILLGTVTKAVTGGMSPFVQFISNKNIALLIGTLIAYALAYRIIGKENIDKAVSKALGNTGIVIMITGTGGALGAVLKGVGVGDILASGISKFSIPAILFVWLVAALLKAAQGSGTVAMITAASLIAPAVATLAINPVLLALAAFSGSLMGCHVNDSGFWITAKIAGLSTTGGFKVYSLVCAILSVVSLGCIYILSFII